MVGTIRSADDDDEGSSVIDFIVGLAMVVTVALAVSQVAVAVYVGNVAFAAAHEGARRAAEFGSSAEIGRARAVEVLQGAVGSHAALLSVRAFRSGDSVVVEIDGSAPVTLPVITSVPIHARAEVLDETEVLK